MNRADLFYLSPERERADLEAYAREAEAKERAGAAMQQYDEPTGPPTPPKKSRTARAASYVGGLAAKAYTDLPSTPLGAAAAQFNAGASQVMEGLAKATLFKGPKTLEGMTAAQEWDSRMQAVKQVVDGVFQATVGAASVGIGQTIKDVIGNPAAMEQPFLDPLFSGFLRTMMGSGSTRTPEDVARTNAPMSLGEVIDLTAGMLGLGAVHAVTKPGKARGRAPAAAEAPATAPAAAPAEAGPRALEGRVGPQRALPPAPADVTTGGAIPLGPSTAVLTPTQQFAILNRMRTEGTLQPFMEMAQTRRMAAEEQLARAAEGRGPGGEPVAARGEVAAPERAPFFERTAMGDQGMIPGTEARAIPDTKTRATVPQTGEMGPLFEKPGPEQMGLEAAPREPLRTQAEALRQQYPEELQPLARETETAIAEVIAKEPPAGPEFESFLKIFEDVPELAPAGERGGTARAGTWTLDDILGEMSGELAGAEPGQRIRSVNRIAGKGKRETWISQPSTYPPYMGELGVPRTRAGANRLLTALGNVVEGKTDGKMEQAILAYAERIKQERLDAEEGRAFVDRLRERGLLGEEGKIAAGLLTRMAVGGLLGCAVGASSEECLKDGLIGMGLGAALSGRLARAVVDRLTKPGVLEGAGPTFYSGVPLPNMERLLSTARVKGYLESLYAAPEFQAEGMEARRGVQRLTTTEKLAWDLIRREGRQKFVERILFAEPGTIFNAEELTAARLVEQAAANQVMLVADRISGGTPKPGDSVRASLATSNAISLKVQALRAEAARATGGMRIAVGADMPFRVDPEVLGVQSRTIAPEMTEREVAQRVTDLKTADPTETSMRTAQLAREVTAAPPNAFMTIWYGVRLLSSPITHLRNLVGSMATIPWSAGVREVGGLVSHINPLHDPAQPRIAIGEGGAKMIAALQSIPNAYRLARKAFREGERLNPEWGTLEGQAKYMESQHAAAAQGFGAKAQAVAETPFLGPMFRYLHRWAVANLNALVAEDQFVQTIDYNGNKAALAIRRADGEGLKGTEYVNRVAELVKMPDSDMVKEAWRQAEENTLNKPAEYGTALSYLLRATDNPVVRVLALPFRMIPARMAEYAMVHTPGLNLLAKQFYSDIAAGGPTAELAVAKLAMGAGAMAGAWWLAANKLLTGSPPKDKAERERLEAAGVQWHTFKIGDVNIPLEYLGPGAIPLTMAADMATLMADAPANVPVHEMGAQLFTAGAYGAVNAFSQYSFIKVMKDVMDSVLDPAGPSAMRFIRERANIVPAISGAARRLIFPGPKETLAGPGIYGEIQTIINMWASQVPIWSETLKPKLDPITGKPKGSAMFGPEDADDPVVKEIARLKGAGLSEPPYWISGAKPPYPSLGQLEAPQPEDGVPLTGEQHHRLVELQTTQKMAGMTLHQALARLIDSPGYKALAEGLPGPGGETIITRHSGKAGALQDVYRAYNQLARETLLEEDKVLGAAALRKQGERALQKVPTAQQPGVGRMIERAIESLTR